MPEEDKPDYNSKELLMRILSLETRMNQFIDAQLHHNVCLRRTTTTFSNGYARSMTYFMGRKNEIQRSHASPRRRQEG
jgi:hypothetical protein